MRAFAQVLLYVGVCVTRERLGVVLGFCPVCSEETLEVWRNSFGRLEAGDVVEVVDVVAIIASPPFLCACSGDGDLQLSSR